MNMIKARRAAGGVIVIAFALALLVAMTSELIIPSPVVTDEAFHERFYDLRDYVAGVAAASQALPADERLDYVMSSLDSYSETLAQQGIVLTFYYDEDTGEVWYYAEHGDSYAVGRIPIVVEASEAEAGAGGGGEGGEGEGGAGEGSTPCILDEECPVEFSLSGASIGSLSVTGSVSFVAKSSFWICRLPWGCSPLGRVYHVMPGQTVEIQLAENVGATYISIDDDDVVLGSAGYTTVVTSIKVDGEEILDSAPIVILMDGKAEEGSVEANIRLYYRIDFGSLEAHVTDGTGEWTYSGDASGVEIVVQGISEGTIAYAGDPAWAGALYAEGCAASVKVGDQTFPAESCETVGAEEYILEVPPIEWRVPCCKKGYGESTCRCSCDVYNKTLVIHVPRGATFKITKAVFIKSNIDDDAIVRVEGGPELVGAHIVVMLPHQVLWFEGNTFEFELRGHSRAVVAFFVFSKSGIEGLAHSYVYVYPTNTDYAGIRDTLTITWDTRGCCGR